MIIDNSILSETLSHLNINFHNQIKKWKKKMNVFSKSIGNRHKVQQYLSAPCCHVAAAANIHGPIPFYRTKQLNSKINTWDN